MPHTDFETPEVLGSAHYEVKANQEKSSAQANETHVFRAAGEIPLGDGGELLGFAKASEGMNPDKQKARVAAQAEASQKVQDLQAKPAVVEWQNRRDALEKLDGDLKKAQQNLESNHSQIARLQAQDPVNQEMLNIQLENQADNQAKVARLSEIKRMRSRSNRS